MTLLTAAWAVAVGLNACTLLVAAAVGSLAGVAISGAVIIGLFVLGMAAGLLE